ncbi:MAG: hypothetical protein HC887_01610 [Desulfobacteraceae bacterium]|nr:hypothetical protein [Desulfobacteraceae bacterium]
MRFIIAIKSVFYRAINRPAISRTLLKRAISLAGFSLLLAYSPEIDFGEKLEKSAMPCTYHIQISREVELQEFIGKLNQNQD